MAFPDAGDGLVPAAPVDGEVRTTSASRAADALAVGRSLIDRFGVLIAWIVTIAIFGFLRPHAFLTVSNFSAIFGTQAVLLILSLAVLIPFICGEFDLSVAGTLGIGYVLTGYLTVLHHWPLYAALPFIALLAVVIGLVNALVVVVVGVPSIIVTLGTGTALLGIGYALISQPVLGLSHGFISVMSHQTLRLPLAFYIGLALTALLWYVLTYTPLGRYMYFVGMNPSVARLSGLRVNSIRVGVFVAAALVAALGGVVLAGSTGASDPDTANSYLLPVFAAVFLGQTTIVPGRFNAWGTFAAIYFLTTGVTGLQILGLHNWIAQVFYGCALVVAVAITRLSGRRVIGGISGSA